MKKLVALAAFAALAACGGDVDEPVEDTSLDTAAADVVPETAPGTYTSTINEGGEVVVTLDADGTYTVTSSGEQVEAGTWEDDVRGTCLSAEGSDGADCWTIQPADEEGIVEVTRGDGATLSYRYES